MNCGAMENDTFGQSVPRAFADPDWISGWGNRPYNWSSSVSVDHQLRPGIAVNAGYTDRSYGNFSVIDNTLVTPADYDPFCITAPVDSRLGSVSGSQICGLYNLNPRVFGLTNTVETFAENFGERTETFDGVDANFAVRIPRGAMVSGGWNIGNSVNTSTSGSVIGVGLGTASKTNTCLVVDSPSLYNCETQNRYLQRFKVNGSIPLPWDLQAAFVYQNLPGPNYSANLTVTSAAIAPSLGRALAGGTSSINLDLLEISHEFIDERLNQLDLQVDQDPQDPGYPPAGEPGSLQCDERKQRAQRQQHLRAHVAVTDTDPRWPTLQDQCSSRLLKIEQVRAIISLRPDVGDNVRSIVRPHPATAPSPTEPLSHPWPLIRV